MINRLPKTPVTDLYQKAQKHLKEGNREKAQECADLGILNVASKVHKGAKDNDLVEGVSVKLWYERFWYFLEKNGLLLGQDDNDEGMEIVNAIINDKKEKTKVNF